MKTGIYVYPESKHERYCVRISSRLTGAKDVKKRFPYRAYLQVGATGYAEAPIEARADARTAARAAALAWAAAHKQVVATPEQVIFRLKGHTDDAKQALDCLAGRATLTEAAIFFIKLKFPHAGTKTTPEAVAAWLKAKREQGRSKAYLDKVADTYKALAEGFPGNVNDITCQQLGKWLAGRKKSDGTSLSNNSFNHYRSDMMALFNWCQRQGWSAHNPAAEIEERTETKPVIGILTPSQALTVLRAAADQPGCPYLAFFALALFAGIRTAELERLTWDDDA
jgi:hypothetical protein